MGNGGNHLDVKNKNNLITIINEILFGFRKNIYIHKSYKNRLKHKKGIANYYENYFRIVSQIVNILTKENIVYF